MPPWLLVHIAKHTVRTEVTLTSGRTWCTTFSSMVMKFLAFKILAENGAHDIIQLLGVILTI